MIFYKPISKLDIIKELFNDIKFEDEYLYGAYVGIDEDGTNVGKCLFKMNGYKCYVEELTCDYSDQLLVEGFLRSALNYCANRNAYMCYCQIDNIIDVLTHLGFEKNNDIYSGDIPTLLKGSCCK